MSTVEELVRLLCDAAVIIRRQAALLMMHGIDTNDGKLESDEFDILAEIRDAVGSDSEKQGEESGIGANRCVCCGAVIPEGLQVCPKCERRKK